ncbi:MAG: hypothetical protein ABI233_09985 [Chthoniobacterales bacterium]
MKRLPSSRPVSNEARPASKPRRTQDHPEAQALLRNLDRLYERLRKRAQAEWLRSHASEDPSDACVSVRIKCDNGEEFTVSGKSRAGKP